MNGPAATECVERTGRWSLIVGVAAAALLAVGWYFDRRQCFRSYLFGYLLWWEIGAGCLGLAMLNQLTGGRWGTSARPFFDAGARTLPLLAVLFVPIGLGLRHIYPWAEESWLEVNELSASRLAYLDEPFFLVRAAGYFVVWLVFALLLTRMREPPRVGPETGATRPGSATETGATPSGSHAAAGGLGLVLLVLTVSFAAVDWMMSLDPHYKSTIFGGIVVAGTAVTGMAVVAASAALTPGQPTLSPDDPPQVLNDLGNLLLAYVMVWTYVVFSQYLITWSGNLPEEAGWYVLRQRGGWGILAIVVLLFHFAVPFAVLLSRKLKRNPWQLASVAVVVLVMHVFFLFWTVAPSWYGPRLGGHWLDAAALVAVGGLWMAEYMRHLKPRLAPFVGTEGEESKMENG